MAENANEASRLMIMGKNVDDMTIDELRYAVRALAVQLRAAYGCYDELCKLNELREKLRGNQW